VLKAKRENADAEKHPGAFSPRAYVQEKECAVVNSVVYSKKQKEQNSSYLVVAAEAEGFSGGQWGASPPSKIFIKNKL